MSLAIASLLPMPSSPLTLLTADGESLVKEKEMEEV
jgi:hypothetical protein